MPEWELKASKKESFGAVPQRLGRLAHFMHRQLWKFSVTSNDSCGNTYKEARRSAAADTLAYEYRTYWDTMASGQENIAVPTNGWFYDELPWRVRTLDFRKSSGRAEVQLAGEHEHLHRGVHLEFP